MKCWKSFAFFLHAQYTRLQNNSSLCPNGAHVDFWSKIKLVVTPTQRKKRPRRRHVPMFPQPLVNFGGGIRLVSLVQYQFPTKIFLTVINSFFHKPIVKFEYWAVHLLWRVVAVDHRSFGTSRGQHHSKGRCRRRTHMRCNQSRQFQTRGRFWSGRGSQLGLPIKRHGRV